MRPPPCGTLERGLHRIAHAAHTAVSGLSRSVFVNVVRRGSAPSLQFGLWALALFALGLWLAHRFAAPMVQWIEHWQTASELAFVATSALAVLLPAASNLPLLPIAVTAWGPLPAAGLLLLGWTIGSMLAYALGRRARPFVLRHWPSVLHAADIERLIHPRHRLLSLIVLRASFPVDVLSHALGLFSRRTSGAEVMLSTALGAAPFALLFAYVPTMSTTMQAAVLLVTGAGFVIYVRWLLRREVNPRPGTPPRACS